MTEHEEHPFDPDWTVPPGETLKECLEELGRTPQSFAAHTGMSLERVGQLIEGSVELTDYDAVLLEYGTGVPERLWRRLEENYRNDLRLGRVWAP